jgi:iron complex outermembrane receptor protein
MKIIFLNFLVFLAFCNATQAQNTLVVKKLESNKGLVGANVTNLLDQTMRVSGVDGNVDISEIAAGTELSISFIGYNTVRHLVIEGKNTIYLEPDYQLLSAVTVVGYKNDRRLYEIAGSYVINSSLEMGKFNDESLVRSMNTLPGIRFEERSPDSYRVSIRGNLLRAPYGVRNVKVYWNEVPYTDPTGSTPLNLMDLNNIGKVEVFKGPVGSVYGAGIGGVLKMYSEVDRVNPISAEMGYSAGSYGFHKAFANVNSGNESHRFLMKYAKQKGDGYRDHTNSDREVIQMSGSFFTSKKRTLTAQALYSDLFYQTPGGLTQEQYDENPRQARPKAAERNSSIDHQNFFSSLTQDYRWSEKLKNTTSVYYTNGVKENPFINNYELEKLRSYGGRTSFDLRLMLGDLPTKFTTGAELNFGNFHASNHGNINGYADTLRYEDELKSLQSFVFFQADLHLSEKWLLTLGASLNYLDYDIHRLRDVAQDTSYRINRSFRPEFMPRIGVIGKLSDLWSLHGSISTGFSPPTTEEIRTSDGGINTDLAAEKGTSYELGFRGNTGKDKLYVDLTAFWMQQKETIVSKTTDQGTVIFENAGSTSQFGLELLLGYAIINDPSRAITLLKIQTAYTYHHFTFKDYIKRKGIENVDYSGNDLTGTAPNISVSSIDLRTKIGFYFSVTYNFTDKIPLNDANTVYGDSYQLITAKAGWQIKLKQKHILELFIGVDNILNEKYSLGNDLNAFGGRYFNAAPARNYYGGVRISFNKINSA